MRSLLIVALLAGTAYAEQDPFATPRPPSAPVADEQEMPQAADVQIRVVNDPQLVTHRYTFHRRKSQIALGVGIMVTSLALALVGPGLTESPVPALVGLPMIGVGLAVTVTAPFDRESTPVPPTRTQVGLAFSGRF